MKILSVQSFSRVIVVVGIWTSFIVFPSYSMDAKPIFRTVSFPDNLCFDSFDRGLRKTEIDEIDDEALFKEQQTFLENMNYEKLNLFSPQIKIGQNENGAQSSQSYYNLSNNESYILHSREFKTKHHHFPCFTSADVINSSYKFDSIYLPKILSNYGYQVQSYYLMSSSRDKVYIFWVEAYNARKKDLDSKMTLSIKRCLKTYFGLIFEIIEEASIDPYMENWREIQKQHLFLSANLLTESEMKPVSVVLVPPSEGEIEGDKHLSCLQTEKIACRERSKSETQKPDSSKKPSPRIKVSAGVAGALSSSEGSESSKTLGLIKKKPNLPLSLDTIKPYSCPNSTNTSPHEYITGLSPKSAPGSSRSRENDIAIQNELNNPVFLNFLKENPKYLEGAMNDYQEQRRRNEPAVSTRYDSPRRAQNRVSSKSDILRRSHEGNSSSSPRRADHRKSEVSGRKMDIDSSNFPLRRRAASRDLGEQKNLGDSRGSLSDSPRSTSDSPRADGRSEDDLNSSGGFCD